MRQYVTIPVEGTLKNPQVPDMLQKLEALGFQFTGKTGDVLTMVYLPEGWEKVPTDHYMYFDIKDANGRVRATIMQKITTHDSDAIFRMKCRFLLDVVKDNPDSDGAERYYVAINDNRPIYRTQSVRRDDPLAKYLWFRVSETSTSLRDVAEQWMDENYPEWKDPFAYWGKTNTPSIKYVLPARGMVDSDVVDNVSHKWRRVGFVFGEVNDNNESVEAAFPEGWSYVPSPGQNDDPSLFEIIDRNCRTRGLVNKNFASPSGYVFIPTRYSVILKYTKEEGKLTGHHYVAVTDCGKEIWRTETAEVTTSHLPLADVALNWLARQHPNWSDPFAYWDEVTK